MGAGHSHALYVHEHSFIHRLPPEAKVVAAVGLVASSAVTPREAIWAFAAYGVILGLLVAISRVPLRFLAVRLLALTPFVMFALLIPVIASGQTVTIGGVELSVEGLWGAWNILIKALIGGTVSILLAATTEIPEIIRGLGVLRVPALFVSIATFMIRYLELVASELGRMRLAMTARGYDPRWITQTRPIAASAGSLFIRSYERGERVHAAMVARGFTGLMPSLGRRTATGADWAGVGALIMVWVVIATLALSIS